MKQVKRLAEQLKRPEGATSGKYPPAIRSRAQRALFDNTGQNEELALRIDTAVRHTKKANWIGNTFKEREVTNAIREEIGAYDVDLDAIVALVKEQDEYQ